MAEYAVISSSGVVGHVLVADADFIAANFPGAVRIDTLTPTPGIGWSYDGTTWTAPTPAAPSRSLYTQKEFLDLFTVAELKVCLAWESNATLTDDQKGNLRIFFQYFDVTNPIDMTEPTTIDGLELLEADGLLATGRAAAIYGSRH